MREEAFEMSEDDFVRLRAALLDRRGIEAPRYDAGQAHESGLRHLQRAAALMNRSGRPAMIREDDRLETAWRDEDGKRYLHVVQLKMGAQPEARAQRYDEAGLPVGDGSQVPIQFDATVGDWVGPMHDGPHPRFEDPALTLVTSLLKLGAPPPLEDATEF